MTEDTNNDSTLQLFVEQSLDKLDQIETELIKLEKTSSPAGSSVAQIYAITLSLKESAALLELSNISLIASKIGSVLDRIFKNEIPFTAELLNIIIDIFDKLNELVSNATLSSDYDVRFITIPLEEAVKTAIATASGSTTATKTPITPASKKEPKIEADEIETSYVAPPSHAKSTHISAGDFRKKFGIKKEIDLSTHANPLGVSKAVSNTIVSMANNCCAFDNDMSDNLKFGLAKRHDISEDQIIVANGAVEILDLTLRLSVTPGIDHVLSYEFGLPEYSRVAALCGIELLRLPRSRNFSPPLDQLVNTANENTAAIIITNPDMPSGYGLPAEELATMATLLPKRTLLIIDERAVEFAWPEDDYSMLQFLDKIPNLVILRSFSWSFGMQGVRLGYALMNAKRAQHLEDSRLPQPISPLNLGAGIAALNHNEFYYSTIALIIRGRERIQNGLKELGCSVYLSQSNFVMFSGPIPAKSLHDKMLDHGFKLKLLDEFGLNDLLTVSIGNNSRNRMFLAAMQNILSE
ncbi:Histidinol-phosphate/aromatic aminotransferase or cobyric acid decarboxylase [Maridesulfovibrio ferrireducens]|uniref:Histidinol-phosphate/aromatic aminotransferase or cobyric acid decarboxylase n=1 Tax=Maridesulfovibrio ferrireducens TaxID=246191 RepID=A0A1G9FM79_9BACT|nr:histidinol-phosphate transaminase [Maridesulfovibrio ferrireducens]SDK89283.1 Histidinol-phosphate/aromatic aminotransferase or cobyric acid decarboxylase [Maridesulfovibrio ferrireducens]